MKETMRNKLSRIEHENNGVTGFYFALKCKTEDGMLCTLNEFHVSKMNCPEGCSFAEYAEAETIKSMTYIMGKLETDNFIYSCTENIAIKTCTIIRVWIEHTGSDCPPHI